MSLRGLLTFRSNLNAIEQIKINIIVVDLVIAYSDTVTNSRPQLDRPTSNPLATPVGAIPRTNCLHGKIFLGCRFNNPQHSRNITANVNFTNKWTKTTDRG